MPAAVWRLSRWALLAAFTAGGCLVTFDDYPVEGGTAGTAGLGGSSTAGLGGSGAVDASVGGTSAGGGSGGTTATGGSGGTSAVGGSSAMGGSSATGGALGAAGSSGTASGAAGVPTDANTDGPCTVDCCGGTCVAGKCQPRVIFPAPDAGNESPQEIAVNGANVYFSSNRAPGPGVLKMPTNGGMPTLFWNKRAVVTSIAADASGVYVAGVDDVTDAGTSGLVERLAPDSGQLQAILDAGGFPSEIALDAEQVYWRKGNTVIRRWSKSDGGSATDVGDTIANLGRIAAANGRLFYHQASGSRVLQRYLQGGDPDLELSRNETDLSSLAANATDVYWPVADGNKIRRVAAGGGGSAIDLFDAGGLPTFMVADGAYVYWLHTGGVLRAGRADGTGPVIDLATSLPTPRKLASDARCVYVTTGTPGRIYRIAKP
jgi:hypothetical protein